MAKRERDRRDEQIRTAWRRYLLDLRHYRDDPLGYELAEPDAWARLQTRLRLPKERFAP